MAGAPLNLAGAGPVVGVIAFAVATDMLMEYLGDRTELKRDTGLFIEQLASVYEKILDSKHFGNSGLVRNTLASKKEIVFDHILQKKGLTAALNLCRYDITEAETNESARVIVTYFAATQQWENATERFYKYHEDKLSNLEDLRQIILEYYWVFLESDETKKEKEIEKEVEEFAFKLIDPAGYEDYLVQKEEELTIRNKRIIIAGLFAVVVSIITLSILYINTQNIYNKLAVTEHEKLDTSLKSIEELIANQNYNEIYSLLRDDLEWTIVNGRFGFFSLKDKNKTIALKFQTMSETLSSILQDLEKRVEVVMDDENYNAIYQSNIKPYNDILGLSSNKTYEQSEDYNEKIESILDDINLKRHTYLLTIENNIQENIELKNKDNAIELLGSVYHYSDAKYKSKLLGLSNVSYKSYWEKRRKELQSEISK